MIKRRRKWIPIKEKTVTKSYDRLAKGLAPIIKRMLSNPKLSFTRSYVLRAHRRTPNTLPQ